VTEQMTLCGTLRVTQITATPQFLDMILSTSQDKNELTQEVISTGSKAELPQCTSLAWSVDGHLFAGYTDNLV
uniref:Uncharacterized protein n=1 Tax=Macaca nemestrina TaxID=9545 RepID=A0A2K6CCK3_MACNE